MMSSDAVDIAEDNARRKAEVPHERAPRAQETRHMKRAARNAS
jgi:hypothetical protein